MKSLSKTELENIQGGFNKSFWKGFCDGAILAGIAIAVTPAPSKIIGELALGGLGLAGCFNGPDK